MKGKNDLFDNKSGKFNDKIIKMETRKENLLKDKRSTLLVNIMKFICNTSFSPLYSFEIKGLENIPENSAFILLPKHQTWMDIPYITIATTRPLYFIAKHSMFINKFTNWFFSSLGWLPLNRERPIESRRSLKTMVELLKQGNGMVVFPEGTYYKNHVGPGNIGIVRLILSKLSYPFIPVGINYTKKKFRTKVTLTYGKPIFMEKDDKSIKHKESANMFLDKAMQQIAILSGLN